MINLDFDREIERAIICCFRG